MTVSEQIIQVIDALCEKFGIVMDWTSNNVFPYVEVLCGKLITYEICTSIVWVVIMISLSIGSIAATKKLAPIFRAKIKEGKQGHSWLCSNDWDIGAGFAIAGLVIINLVSIIVIGMQIMDIVKCLVFPEMYVFEYINALIQ